MKKIMTLLILCLVFIGMTGCAPKMAPPSPYAKKGYTNNPKKSFARNIVKSAGLRDVKDVSSEEMSKAFNGKIQADNLGAATFATLNFISNLNPLGLATLPLSFLSWNHVFGAKIADQRAYPHVYAWMPRGMVETSEEAITVLNQILHDALQKALSEIKFSKPHKVETIATPFILYSEIFSTIKEEGFKVSGGTCDSDDEKCLYGFGYFLRSDVGIRAPYPGVAPDFLGKQKVWAFTRASTFYPYASSFNLKGEKRTTPLPDLKVYTATSKHLPEWVYIYLPNSQKSHLIYANGQPLPMPVVLNQGNIHLFVKPEKS